MQIVATCLTNSGGVAQLLDFLCYQHNYIDNLRLVILTCLEIIGVINFAVRGLPA